MRDVNVSSWGVSDKTMGKFYSTAAFVKVLFDKRVSIRHYGLNAGANHKGWEMLLVFEHQGRMQSARVSPGMNCEGCNHLCHN